MKPIALGNLGLAYKALEQYPKAIRFHQQSLALSRELGHLDGQGTAFNNLGTTLARMGRLPAAEEALQGAIVIWDQLRHGNTDPNQVSLFEQQARSYRALQQVLVAQNNTDRALEIAEHGRARAFVELLARRLAPDQHRPMSPPPTLSQIRQIAATPERHPRPIFHYQQ